MTNSRLILGLVAALFIAVATTTEGYATTTECATEAAQNPNKFYDEVTGKWYTRQANDGLFPTTRLRKLTHQDMIYLTDWEMRIMRNEIYARHGYIFASADLREYFGSQSWYYPTTKNVTLNSIEQYNVNFIKQYEEGGTSQPSSQDKFYDPQTGQWHTRRANDGLYPITRVRKLTYNDIANYSKSQLRIMRNEIYARHSYIFASADLREYFGRQSWYYPTTKNVTLNSIEQYNVNFIKQYE